MLKASFLFGVPDVEDKEGDGVHVEEKVNYKKSYMPPLAVVWDIG